MSLYHNIFSFGYKRINLLYIYLCTASHGLGIAQVLSLREISTGILYLLYTVYIVGMLYLHANAE